MSETCSSCRGECSSPVATIEEIQRRLVRPPSSSLPSRNPIRKIDEEEEAEKKKKKLEDYLDPVLLSTISSHLKGGREEKARDVKFEWPTEELKVFLEDSRTDWIDGAVSLSNDLHTDVKEEEKRSYSPFRQFEETVSEFLKR